MGLFVLAGFGAVLLLFVLIGVFGAFYTVEQQTVGIMQRFGKFTRSVTPGLGIKIPIIDQIVSRVSLRIQPQKITLETKTSDDVFVKLPVVVQFRVLPDKVYDAYYKLAEPTEQIEALVMDVVRAEVPKLKLDEAFLQKDHVADAIKQNLAPKMAEYGYEILSVQVLDVEPDQKVKDAMNHINASQRLQVAAEAEAKANKIKIVAAAEAEAESKKLQGEGIAKQRAAIILGLTDSVQAFGKATGIKAEEVMQLVTLTQYLDTLKDLAHGSGSRVIFLPHSPGGLTDLTAQIRTAILSGNEAETQTAN